MSTYTALITPFDEEGSLDYPGLLQLITHQREGGVDGLLILGTTAETPTLTLQEKCAILEAAASSSLPYMVGCGSNCTRTTLENIRLAAEYGAEEVLIVSPYYNRPSPRALMAHFETIADQSPCPILIYNHPGRTHCLVTLDMLLSLAKHPNIVGVKEVTPDFLNTLMTLKAAVPSFRVYAGDDPLALTARVHGADGLISVAANLYPHWMQLIQEAPLTEAFELQRELWPLFQALTLDTNPVPIKAALQLSGLPAGSPRAPLLPLHVDHQALLQTRLACMSLS